MKEHAPAFGTLHDESLASQVVDKIVKSIQGGIFEAGDKLPPERELATMLGISRPTLRQALQSLRVLGVLDIRQGSGTYVSTNLVGSGLAEKAAELLMTEDSPLQALEMRTMIEPDVAAIAAQRAEPSDLARLEEVLEGMERRLDGNEPFGQWDLDFHLTIGRSLRNKYVDHVLALILQTWFGPQSPWLEILDSFVKTSGRLDLYGEQHRAIHEAICNGDPPAARKAMREHLEQVDSDFQYFSLEGVNP